MKPVASIRRKVTLALFGAFTLALGVAALTLGIFEYRAADTRARSTLESLADTLAFSLAAALDFNSPEVAEQSLARLEPSGLVVGATVFRLENGRPAHLFAQYVRAGAVLQFPAEPQSPGFRRVGERAQLASLMRTDNQPVALLLVEADIRVFRRGLREVLYLLGVVLVVLAAVSYGLSRLLQQALTQPLVRLAETAAQVHLTGDFSLRAPVTTGDEIGRLGITFNEMLAGIATRDAQLVESGNFRKAVMDGAGAAVITTDIDFRVRTFNQAAERLLGYTAAEMIGRATVAEFHDLDEVAAAAQEQGRRLGVVIEPALTVFGVVAQREGTYAREWTYIRKDRRRVPVQLAVSELRGIRGEPLGFCGVATDLSERRAAEFALLESESRFRTLAESDLCGLLVQENFIIRYANPSLAAMFGYESPAELIGRKAIDVVAPAFRAEVVERIARVLAGEKVPPLAAIQAARKDGSLIWVSTGVVISNWDGRPAVQSYILDINDRKLAEEARQADLERQRQLEAQLFQAQKMESIGALAGGIAHDFNNILTGIMGFTEIAGLSLEPDHPVREDLEEVRKGAVRAKDLVAQILTFSRQKDSEQVPLDLSRPVGEAIKLVRASTPTTIEIRRNLESVQVRADPTQIHQVALNLCTNAVHALRGGHGTLEVEVQPCLFEASEACDVGMVYAGRYARLTIHDTGHGMDAATLKRIFEPFFTTKIHGEGTGLGLALVRSIVLNHRGALRVSSTQHVGTVFDVFFPVCSEVETVQPAPVPIARGDGENVAIVDDENSIAAFAAVRLEHLGYRTMVFTDPVLALEAIRAQPEHFDVLLTDLTMPHLTGFDLVHQLRGAGIGIPAIIASGYGSAAPPTGIGQLGRVAHLAKPFTGEELARAIRSALQQREA